LWAVFQYKDEWDQKMGQINRTAEKQRFFIHAVEDSPALLQPMKAESALPQSKGITTRWYSRKSVIKRIDCVQGTSK